MAWNIPWNAAQRILGPATLGLWPYPNPPRAPSEEGTPGGTKESLLILLEDVR
jgi:hypothetical protein